MDQEVNVRTGPSGHGQEVGEMFCFPSVSPFRIQRSPLYISPGFLYTQAVLRKEQIMLNVSTLLH